MDSPIGKSHETPILNAVKRSRTPFSVTLGSSGAEQRRWRPEKATWRKVPLRQRPRRAPGWMPGPRTSLSGAFKDELRAASSILSIDLNVTLNAICYVATNLHMVLMCFHICCNTLRYASWSYIFILYIKSLSVIEAWHDPVAGMSCYSREPQHGGNTTAWLFQPPYASK